MSPTTPTKGSGSSAIQRQDTSICSHLRTLLEESNKDDMHVKTEAGLEEDNVAPDPSEAERMATFGLLKVPKDIEKHYVDTVKWGAKEEGVKRRKTSPAQCHSCSKCLTRPFVCLTCPFVGCLSLGGSSSTGKECMRDHWAKEVRCNYAIDSSSGAIYCGECDDLTYPDTFEHLSRLSRLRVEEENDKSREQRSMGKGRERGDFRGWTGNIDNTEVTRAHCGGLRPLLNLSQTCFLSAILQAFIHNPLLKAYFLSDKHNRHVCTHPSKGLAVGKPIVGPEPDQASDREKGCMCCEMDRAFEEFHSGDKSPFGPITMLYSMWHASAELEGYGQQDAHSFFLAALDQIHARARGQLASCNCIAHQTFSGALLSSVTCSKCNTTSSTTDPTLDIQLDFPSNPTETENLTLAGMLRRFCAEEKVGDHGRGYDCSSCGGGAGVVATRKLAIKKLPPVLSFQLKRFAHNATSTKIESHVKFPSTINMKPYVESDRPQSDSAKSTSLAASDDGLPESLFQYDLFAVVTHEGKLDNGHYWADVLSGEEWWHCDDDKITPTTMKQVQSQRAYMLFYVKRSLTYAQPLSKLLSTPSTNTVNLATTSLSNGNTVNGGGGGGGMNLEVGPPQPGSVASKGRNGHPISGMAV